MVKIATLAFSSHMSDKTERHEGMCFHKLEEQIQTNIADSAKESQL